MSQIVRDEYGRPFYLHNADEAWKVSDNTATLNWGTWEPLAFADKEPKAATDDDSNLITEAVIQEANCFIEELNNLTLSAPNEEREKIYFLIESVSHAMKHYLRNEKD
jgi:hypothetical protein